MLKSLITTITPKPLSKVTSYTKKYVHKDPIVRYKVVKLVYPPPGDNLQLPGKLTRLAGRDLHEEDRLRLLGVR